MHRQESRIAMKKIIKKIFRLTKYHTIIYTLVLVILTSAFFSYAYIRYSDDQHTKNYLAHSAEDKPFYDTVDRYNNLIVKIENQKKYGVDTSSLDEKLASIDDNLFIKHNEVYADKLIGEISSELILLSESQADSAEYDLIPAPAPAPAPASTTTPVPKATASKSAPAPTPAKKPVAVAPKTSATPPVATTPTPTPTPAPAPPASPAPIAPPPSGPVPPQIVPGLSVKGIEDLINAERAKFGKTPYKIVPLIEQAATLKTKHMFDNRYIAHCQPVTNICDTYFLKQVGYSYRAFGGNIAWGYATSKQVVDAWMGSAGHRYNILSSFKEMGVGITGAGVALFLTYPY